MQSADNAAALSKSIPNLKGIRDLANKEGAELARPPFYNQLKHQISLNDP